VAYASTFVSLFHAGRKQLVRLCPRRFQTLPKCLINNFLNDEDCKVHGRIKSKFSEALKLMFKAREENKAEIGSVQTSHATLIL
jgi:hypothetical protein